MRSPDGFGANDLPFAINQMSKRTGWIQNAFQDRDPNVVRDAAQRNASIASDHVERVLLVRWIVFRTFIQIAKEKDGGTLPESIKHDWLLFQILPLVRIGAVDLFVVLFTTLRKLDFAEVSLLLTNSADPAFLASSFDAARDKFGYVLDEGQAIGDTYAMAFANEEASIPQPVLRPIIRTMTKDESLRVKVIVSGTGFSFDIFKSVTTSQVGKPDDKWTVVHQTGDFSNREAQKDYVSHLLPPSFLASEPGIALLPRLYSWLRGRWVFSSSNSRFINFM